jgi:GNAT superfamily N-acetyltransferase
MSTRPAQLPVASDAISLRRFCDSDSLGELTAMLHRAFTRLGQMGLNCACTDQTIAVTEKRIGKGECYVAVCNERIVGTITLYRPDPASESAWYHRPEVASVHQLCVDPEFQHRGVGTSLLNLAEAWARARGFQELALDTPHAARHLVKFYIGSGYRPVESVLFQARRYVSVVLSKDVVAPEMSIGAARPILHLPRRTAAVRQS